MSEHRRRDCPTRMSAGRLVIVELYRASRGWLDADGRIVLTREVAVDLRRRGISMIRARSRGAMLEISVHRFVEHLEERLDSRSWRDPLAAFEPGVQGEPPWSHS